MPGESRNARRRRRRRNKNRGTEGNAATAPAGERPEPGPAVRDGGPDLVNHEPVEVAGYLDLRDEGYGFLRING